MSDFTEDQIDKMCAGKRFYKTANLAARAAAGRRSVDGVFLRVYQCPVCGGFHLTKQEKPHLPRKDGQQNVQAD